MMFDMKVKQVCVAITAQQADKETFVFHLFSVLCI